MLHIIDIINNWCCNKKLYLKIPYKINVFNDVSRIFQIILKSYYSYIVYYDIQLHCMYKTKSNK